MTHFTLVERKMLKEILREEKSYGEMSKILGKSKSSVWMEVHKGGGRKHYDPYKSEERYRRGRISRKKRKKLEISPGLKKYIVAKIQSDWSPEQISSILFLLRKERRVISHETIYQFIYSKEGKELKLWQHLRHKKRGERRHWGSRKSTATLLIPIFVILIALGKKVL